MPHSYIIIYVLLATLLTALGFSFLQLYKQPYDTTRVYVPHSHILWLKHFVNVSKLQEFSSCYDRLVYELTKSYHVMTLHLLHSSVATPEPIDTLYKSYIILYTCSLEIIVNQVTKQFTVEPGDVFTIPSHLLISNLPSIQNCVHCLLWGIHPFYRPYRISVNERNYIYQKWQRQKPKMYLVQQGSKIQNYHI